MKISVTTLKGNQFDLHVLHGDKVLSVKERIEEIQGRDAFPCSQQLLIYKGKVLKDETTLEENSVVENNFVVVMLTKTEATASAIPSASATVQVASTALSSASPAPAPVPVLAPAPAAMVAASTKLPLLLPLLLPLRLLLLGPTPLRHRWLWWEHGEHHTQLVPGQRRLQARLQLHLPHGQRRYSAEQQ